jgi:uncharacterized repeat protein (TIGR01451 family)
MTNQKLIKKVILSVLSFSLLTSFTYTTLFFQNENMKLANASSSTFASGQVSIDKKYLSGTTEVDNIAVNPGSNVTVRLKYDNTGNQAVIDAQIKDSLPAGFTYVPGSFKNCVTPSSSEQSCDTLNATNKDIAFNTLISTSGISPVAGLYDATSPTSTGGTAPTATSGILEIGKKRYINLNQCLALSHASGIDPNRDWYNYTASRAASNQLTGTGASNSATPVNNCQVNNSTVTNTSTALGVYAGYDANTLPIGGGPYGDYLVKQARVQVLDTLNKRYTHLEECSTYSTTASGVTPAKRDFFAFVVSDPIVGTVQDTSTGSDNSPTFSPRCNTGDLNGTGGYGNPDTYYTNYPTPSGSKTLTTDSLGKRYFNLEDCTNKSSYNSGVDVDWWNYTLSNTVISPGTGQVLQETNTGMSNNPNPTPKCIAGSYVSSFGSTGTADYYTVQTPAQQNIDLLDSTRGRGYVEYQVVTSTTPGTFGADSTLKSVSNKFSTITNPSASNLITVNGATVTSTSTASIITTNTLPLVSILTAADFGRITLKCGQDNTVVAGQKTTCTFSIPDDRYLPNDFKMGIGDVTPSGYCTIYGSKVTCYDVPVTTTKGNQLVYVQTSNDTKISTGKSVTVNSGSAVVNTCEAGKVYQNSTCIPCPIGFYCDGTNITPCPNDLTTANQGAKSILECVAVSPKVVIVDKPTTVTTISGTKSVRTGGIAITSFVSILAILILSVIVYNKNRSSNSVKILD